MIGFDELHQQMEEKLRALPYDEYFDGMDLTEEEKEKRKAFSEEFEDIMLFIFSLFLVMQEYDYINKNYIVEQLRRRYSELVLRYMDVDDYIDDYIRVFSEQTVETTLEHSDDAYYTSMDRAMFISENEANTTFNHSEFLAAVKAGKTKKRWVDVRDKRERKTHLEVGGTVLPIQNPFVVGNSLMLYAKDQTYSPEAKEICGCRCTTKYY